jgi:hypothetical protein
MWSRPATRLRPWTPPPAMRILIFHHRIELYLLIGRQNGADFSSGLHPKRIVLRIKGLELRSALVEDGI